MKIFFSCAADDETSSLVKGRGTERIKHCCRNTPRSLPDAAGSEPHDVVSHFQGLPVLIHHTQRVKLTFRGQFRITHAKYHQQIRTKSPPNLLARALCCRVDEPRLEGEKLRGKTKTVYAKRSATQVPECCCEMYTHATAAIFFFRTSNRTRSVGALTSLLLALPRAHSLTHSPVVLLARPRLGDDDDVPIQLNFFAMFPSWPGLAVLLLLCFLLSAVRPHHGRSFTVCRVANRTEPTPACRGEQRNQRNQQEATKSEGVPNR